MSGLDSLQMLRKGVTPKQILALTQVADAAQDLIDMARESLPYWFGDEDWPQFDNLAAAVAAVKAGNQ